MNDALPGAVRFIGDTEPGGKRTARQLESHICRAACIEQEIQRGGDKSTIYRAQTNEPRAKAALKAEYQNCSNDLSTPFLARALELLEPGGRLGFITQSSILSLPSYEGIRKQLVTETILHSVVELGFGAFPLQGGEKFNSVLLVAESSRNELEHSQTTFIDLTDRENKPESLNEILSSPNRLNESNYFTSKQSNFESFPFCSFQYSCPAPLIKIIANLPDLSSLADVRQGLATTDNDRFLRHWWHVPPQSIGVSWFPYVKGAGGDRWSSPILHLVNFEDNGREIKAAVA